MGNSFAFNAIYEWKLRAALKWNRWKFYLSISSEQITNRELVAAIKRATMFKWFDTNFLVQAKVPVSTLIHMQNDITRVVWILKRKTRAIFCNLTCFSLIALFKKKTRIHKTHNFSTATVWPNFAQLHFHRTNANNVITNLGKCISDVAKVINSTFFNDPYISIDLSNQLWQIVGNRINRSRDFLTERIKM